jgi:co-chaperonin GroES (HSP10)
MDVIPKNDRILVKMDPLPEKVGGGILFRPNDEAHDSIMGTGVVVATGPGKYPKKGGKRVPVGVEPGEGVVFIRYLEKTKTNQQLQHHLNREEILIQPNDILLVYDRDDTPRFE